MIEKQEKEVKQLVKQYNCTSEEQHAEHSAMASTQSSNAENHKSVNIEILGDNLDLTITPAHMTINKQRKSLHWFLLMVKKNRVTYADLKQTNNQHNSIQKHILDVDTSEWVPSTDQIHHLKQNMIFHVSKVLLKYVKGLENIPYASHIHHPYMHLLKQKSEVLNCELVEESENSSTGMIKILQKVHELAVPHVEGNLSDRVVFGGDVLTNERAFSAQAAMQNNKTGFDSLQGLIHRPEGLHRQFNFLSVMGCDQFILIFKF